MRLMGLIPNELHADEPWVEKYAGELFYNIVTKADFDPHDYKYGSFIYYLEALPYFPIMSMKYISESILNPNTTGSFRDFVISMKILDQRNMTIFWMQRAQIALIGGLSVLVIYQIVKKLFHKHAALLAAFTLAVLPLHVRESHYIVPDLAITFFISLSILFMVNLFQTGKLKWYILSGFMIGFSSTLKYFPLALLAYPFALLLVKKKDWYWIRNSMIGIVSILPGAFAGVPYLFLNPQTNIPVFQKGVETALNWYRTPFTEYASAIVLFIRSKGQEPLPDLSIFIPPRFTRYYLTLLFYRGFGVFPSIAALMGIFSLLILHHKKILFIMIIPIFSFLYFSLYIPALYERQADTLLPFLALLVGVFLWSLWRFMASRPIPYKRTIFLIILILVFYYPFTQSFASSWACGKPHIFQESAIWISRNIPSKSVVAFKGYMPFPQGGYELIPLLPNDIFSIEEVRSTGAPFAFINIYDTLIGYTNEFISFFIKPTDLYQNYYPVLALHEYRSRANLLQELSRPAMCNQPQLVYYQLPPALPNGKNPIIYSLFDSNSDMNYWHLQEYSKKSKADILYSAEEGSTSKGSLQFTWSSINYTLPRIVSDKIRVTPGAAYTAAAQIKSDTSLKETERDGFLRIDFYENENANTVLPGPVTALSPRIYGDFEWKQVAVTAKAPANALFMIVSLQVNGSKPEGTFYFDDILLLQSNELPPLQI